MTTLSPTENALVAYALMDEVNEMLANGGRVEDIMRDIARAQVYATLATVTVKPTQEALQDAIYAAVETGGDRIGVSVCGAAAEAVGRLL